jgi:hypothetical protein
LFEQSALKAEQSAGAAVALRGNQSTDNADIRSGGRADRGRRAGPHQTPTATARRSSRVANDFAPLVPAVPTADARSELSAADRKALERAHVQLEGHSFAIRVAELAGQPVDCLLGIMPKFATRGVNRAIEVAIFNCLKLAISLTPPNPRGAPAAKLSSFLVGLSGGVSGFFGFAALPFELPVTTTLMLRAIAQTAQHHGEDLSKLEVRLACLEVFALGMGKSPKRLDLGYYAARAVLSRLTEQASALLIERGAASVSAPIVARLLSAIVSRFGIIVSQRFAAGALPAIGAVGAAAVNIAFMKHFQRIAQGHFTIRRLERRYGADVVRRHYQKLLQPRLAA